MGRDYRKVCALIFLFSKIMKKSLLLILLSIFTFATIRADITWSLSDDGTLTISGTDMPDYSFAPWYSQRDKIKKVIIENGVTNIGLYAFNECTNLTSITIPNSVTSIGSWVFCCCSSLTSITIPNSVTWIGDAAFSDCSGLSSITIPNSVTHIGGNAFQKCIGLTSVTIPNSVTSIEAFWGCTGLTSVTIPNSVTYIGAGAFTGCSGLTSITIPNSVTWIGDGAFWNCTGLTSINIPKSVTTIDKRAFRNCSGLTSITIPNRVKKIGEYAFADCDGLTSITCMAVTPPDCKSDCFYNVDNSIPVYVPAKSVDSYDVANEWKEFLNIQAISTTKIDDINISWISQNEKSRTIIYDMNGIKVNGNAIKSSIYIKNGKKIIIK